MDLNLSLYLANQISNAVLFAKFYSDRYLRYLSNWKKTEYTLFFETKECLKITDKTQSKIYKLLLKMFLKSQIIKYKVF